MPGIQLDIKSVASILERNAANYTVEIGPNEIGHVLEAGDGIALVDGLPGVMAEEMVMFSNDLYGMAMNLEKNHVGIIVLGDYTSIEQGDTVTRTCNVLQVPVGNALLGRVVTPLGMPIDGRGRLNCSEYRRVETDAPGIVEREPVNTPLQTGLRSIDAMTAIGRGQRELIIGDRQTGKTAIAIDTIINQSGGDVFCVYVAIGQKMSTLANVVDTLEKHNALSNCIIVVATASNSAPLQYIAPFAGCAMAEYFRDRGKDVLIVYDDLSKHAVAYREISLLLRRPPGREAFPGDIFYLHSRLLERASKLNADHGAGSLTALPIVETKQGDYSAYIPTNLISITDGQIYLETSLFHQGFRPAINVGLSVSRVGGNAQLPAMKKVALRLRLELAQYREVASFSQLTTELDTVTLKQIHRGERLAEILKQPQYNPMPIEQQICILWAVVNGHLDHISLHDIPRFQHEWIELLENTYPKVAENLRRDLDLSNETEDMLVRSLDRFRHIFITTENVPDINGDRVIPNADNQATRSAQTIIETANLKTEKNRTLV
ncbi:MAG: F0F1 ATP synthase subunit alpha [Lentisphaerae bacterium]|nr:F0F1 ATP synthase subunit alpha [Lentisphaerota bacterium]